MFSSVKHGARKSAKFLSDHNKSWCRSPPKVFWNFFWHVFHTGADFLPARHNVFQGLFWHHHRDPRNWSPTLEHGMKVLLVLKHLKKRWFWGKSPYSSERQCLQSSLVPTPQHVRWLWAEAAATGVTTTSKWLLAAHLNLLVVYRQKKKERKKKLKQ